MTIDKSAQNSATIFNILFIPLILLSKYIRWTIMRDVLVRPSIGYKMIGLMRLHMVPQFQASLTLQGSGGASGLAMNNAVALFDSINFLKLDNYIAWEIFFTIIFNFLLFLFVQRFYQTTPKVSWHQNLIIYMAIAILNVFCLNMSKEPYQLIFFMLMGVGISHIKGYRNKSYWVFFTIVLTILFARKYYILILAFFLVTQIIIKKLFNEINIEEDGGKRILITRIFYTFIIVAVAHFVLFQFVENSNEDMYETLISVNDRSQTRKSVATSEIVPWFGSSNQVSVTLEFFVKIFRLSLPIELLAIGKWTYILIIVFQGLLIKSIVSAFSNRTIQTISISNSEEEEEEDDNGINEEEQEIEESNNGIEQDKDITYVYSESKDRKETRTIALYMYIAFLLCSACFEPDFGSWTRHVGVAFPIILFIL